MPRTVQHYLDRMTLAAEVASSSGIDSRHVLIDTFNDAGRWLCSVWPWSWLIVGPVLIPAVGGEDSAPLPANYGRCESIFIDRTVNTGSGCAHLVTLRRIADLKAAGSAGWSAGGDVYVSLDGMDHHTKETHTRRKLVIFPTPSANGTPTLSLIYRKRWIDFDDSDTSGVPDIDPDWERLLVLACEGMVRTTEWRESFASNTDIQAELERLKSLDGGRLPSLGEIADTVYTDNPLNIGTVTPTEVTL